MKKTARAEESEMMVCPHCKEYIEERSRFCNMCGFSIEDARKFGEIPVVDKLIDTQYGQKQLQLFCKDIVSFEEPIDILTVSAFPYNYEPTAGTVIGALVRKKSIMVDELAKHPFFDLRKNAGCWISQEVELSPQNLYIKRIGCVERIRQKDIKAKREDNQLLAVKSYFHMLDIMAELNIKMDTVLMPLLGTGNQEMNSAIIAIPLINEILSSLKRNPSIKRIVLVAREWDKTCILADALNSSLNLYNQGLVHKQKKSSAQPFVFISYSNDGDRETAELLVNSLKKRGIDVWFAPNDIISGDYASAIVEAINKCTHFICVISENSMKSPHVLNEVDLAFQHVRDGVSILPFRMDSKELNSSFMYYLSRMEWHPGYPEPIHNRVEDFITKIFGC